MHIWGDEDFDWAALNEACAYLTDRCRQFGRLGVWTKEKWGTLRVESVCAWSSWPIHNLVYPGYVFYQWPLWVMKYVEFPLWRLFSFLRITKIVHWYQHKVLKFFWNRAAKKWPHIKEEIMCEYKWYVED